MLLGDKDLRMTTRYAHLSQEHLQRAVKLLEETSEESGGYNTATEALWIGTWEGQMLEKSVASPTGFEPVFQP